jgi:hypothetical protein
MSVVVIQCFVLQTCFKGSWADHKQVHKKASEFEGFLLCLMKACVMHAFCGHHLWKNTNSVPKTKAD